MSELSAERVRQGIVEHARRLGESAVAAGPDAGVPTAPEWTVTDLVGHVGQTQHWVAEIIERRIVDPTQLPTELAAVPADPGEWQAWLTEAAQRVADACSDEALNAPVFNAAGDDRSGAQFWMTSMLNESVVHGFDAANAASAAHAATTASTANAVTGASTANAVTGASTAKAASAANIATEPGSHVEADIAAALISNHLAMLTSPTWAMQRPKSAHALRGTGQTLQWRATDSADAWHVVRRPGGATWQPGTHQADVTLTGPAGSLLLTMTRRLPLTAPEATGITITGDPTLAQHWLDNTAHVTN